MNITANEKNSDNKQVGEIKKLDFDFGDTDDFFNSFAGPGVTKVESTTFGNEFSMDEPKATRTKKTNKLVEVNEEDSNPFGGMVSNLVGTPVWSTSGCSRSCLDGRGPGGRVDLILSLGMSLASGFQVSKTD